MKCPLCVHVCSRELLGGMLLGLEKVNEKIWLKQQLKLSRHILHMELLLEVAKGRGWNQVRGSELPRMCSVNTQPLPSFYLPDSILPPSLAMQ